MRDNEHATVILVDSNAPPGARRVLDRFSLGERLADILAKHTWKTELKKVVEERGFEVIAVNLVHGSATGEHIAVTVAQKGIRKTGAGKTATLHGKPIDQIRAPRSGATIRRRG
jgi:hypothetical protein